MLRPFGVAKQVLNDAAAAVLLLLYAVSSFS